MWRRRERMIDVKRRVESDRENKRNIYIKERKRQKENERWTGREGGSRRR